MQEDAELLRAWRSGDASAGNALLERYFDRLRRFFGNKVRDGVEDLIQSTLLTCVRRKDAIRDDGSFAGYLFTVARHELYRYLRTLERARAVDDVALSSIEALGASPNTVLAARAEQRLLLEALRRIPVQSQILLELHYWEDLPTHELADVLEIPRGTVKSRLRRARELLEHEMRGLATSPEVLESTLSGFERWATTVKQSL